MLKLFSNKWIYNIEKLRVTNSVTKMTIFAHGGISIKLFIVNLHITNECLSYKFYPYSISTGHTKVDSVAYYCQGLRVLTLLGLGLTKINTVLANFNNPRPSLILNN